MKILPLTIVIMSITMLVEGQSLDRVTSITFTKQNRGFLDELIISRDSVQGFVENHRAPEQSQQYATSIDNDSWAKLILALQNVSLADLDGLQSPTVNRAHDGAIHSTITIYFDDGQSISHSFDDENPHDDLKPLLDAILQHKASSAR
jgi:hypothetical protein